MTGPLAHGATSAVWSTWTVDPFVIVTLVAGTALYVQGAAGLTGWSRRGLCFFLGVSVVFVALVSPLDAASGHSFAPHMIQHLLLTTVAAPLIALSRAGLVWLLALPPGGRRAATAAGRKLRPYTSGPRGAVTAALLHAGALWLWHVPVLYEAALRNDVVHGLEHVTLLGTAVVFWSAIVQAGSRAQVERGTAIVILFVTAVQSGALGALLTFSPTLWYPVYEIPRVWGLSPLDDQILAGLMMWIPGGMVYVVAALVLVARWLRAAERRAGLPERRIA